MALSKIPKTTQTAKVRSDLQRAQPKNTTQADAATRASDPASEMLALQHSVGNRALQRMLTRQGIQPKLTVGASNDKYEQEADKVAAEATNDAPSATTLGQPGLGAVQRHGLTPLKSPSTSKPNKDNSAGQVQRSGGGDSFQASSSFEGAMAQSKGRGQQLPGETRSEMESKFGVGFGGVRVHTGPQAVQLSRSVNAEAFTHGQDIFMNKSRFAPTTKPGKQLLAHELTHVVQQTGGVQRKQGAISGGMTADRISRKKVTRRVDFIKMKRKDTHIAKMLLSKMKLAKKPDDAYGHWWTELGAYTSGGDWTPTESYGWWPSTGVDIKSTLGGVAGQLNGVGHFGGSTTEDPHHGEAASEFNPAMQVDDKADMQAFRKDTMTKVRNFSRNFQGSWNWRFGWGKNCHTFQERMMKALGMKKANGAAKLDTGDFESHEAAEKEEKDKQKMADFEKNNPGINYKLTSDVDVDGMMGGTVTIPKDSLVRMLEQGAALDTIPDWQKVQIYWDGRYHETYKDSITKNATPV